MSDPHSFSGSHRGRWQPPDPVELQRQISQYKVLELLGQGGMGAVYKGWQVSLERYVAIKILPPDVEDGDAHFVDRFKQEAKTMAKFLHPGIVAVFDAGETPSGLLYIVMEYVEGTDVAHMLQRKGLLDATTALAITANVCDALHYAHARGVIHRDIKPANIMVNEEGVVKVADFGLAKATGSMQMGLTRSDMSMGTPDFIAPEALMLGVVADHRADLYAVGVMLYNMLTGEIPRGRFKAASQKSGCDLRFDAIIDRAMEQDREQRYQSSQDIRRDLEVILTTPVEKAAAPEEAPAATVPLPRSARPTETAAHLPAPAPKKSSVGLVVLVLGAVAVLAVGAFFVFKKPAGATTSAGIEKADDRASSTAATESWQDLSKDSTLKGAEVTPNGLAIRGWVTFPEGPKRDGAVRYRAPFSKYLVASLRPFVRKDAQGDFSGRWYQAHPNGPGDGAQVEISGSGFSPLTDPQHRRVPLIKTGEMCELELRAVGSRITVKINGQIALETEDTTLSAGRFGIWALPEMAVVVQSLEVLNLDAAGAAAATPTTATKDTPFVNSLGMRFVPVPITGGPTDKQRVLFSVWDTRVQDYEIFARETKREWPKPPYEQGPTHPAVNVSWEDAQAFCAWLTGRERKAGKLGANERYRLPTDHEWSCAVGIGDKEDAALLPGEKKGKIDGIFAWGSAWPPPDKTTNLASEELRPMLKEGEFTVPDNASRGVIENYHDGYAYTSPVESFAPNPLGLHDMGGNVQQWCEDWNSKDQKKRTLRGASWATQERVFLLSSNRPFALPAERFIWRGFRVVLELVPRATTGTAPDGLPTTNGHEFTRMVELPQSPNPSCKFVSI